MGKEKNKGYSNQRETGLKIKCIKRYDGYSILYPDNLYSLHEFSNVDEFILKIYK